MAVNSRRPPRNLLIGKEVLSAFLIVAALVAITTLVQVQLLQIPGYLLLLGSDLLLPDLSGWTFTAVFAVYLYAVAIIAGNLYRWGRSLQAQR